ncbi:glycoside hydrolase family 3 C-terminal domain-containing protein [Paenibacillus sp. LjRoot56]|uniref:glycoside hydrolase family 3 C-terminal domain-containing protein n=1 Tax=Paenibacillus sp. LjRoot56 TaxID=3342333 RepID=UPI003ECCEFE2
MQRNITELIDQMTLEEKAGLCSGLDFWRTKGIERLGIPSVMITDGPHGLRKQNGASDHLGLMDSVPATCFPSAAGMASSWDRELMHKVGIALGKECQAEEVAVLLGPGVNIKRSPLCGRNFEYFSEDPYLSSEMAANQIIGVQSQGIGTSLKHFAVNNQEYRRMSTNVAVDERTLREIYLASFEGAVKQGKPWTVMSAYNQVNGEFCSENTKLLTDILKEEWGHDGFVVSDWGAVNDRVDGLTAGLELEMPSTNGTSDLKIVEAVRSGKLSEEVLNRAVERFLTVIFKAVDQRREGATYDQDAHHQLAREVARESMVLLKNKDGLLPLTKSDNIALIGALAKTPRYQGSGSSRINPTKLEDIHEELCKSVGSTAKVVFAQGYDLGSDEVDEGLLSEAVNAALQADVAIIVAGLPEHYESEGFDRTHLSIPANQIRMIEAIAAAQSKVVVVLCNGAPIEMPWIDSAKSVLEAYLGGQALGGAIADLLFGDANPCGKLAETFPQKLEHNPSYLFFPGEGDRVTYKEGIFVGYRYYDAVDRTPLFPFGHGLSYTSFSYSDLTVDKKEIVDVGTVEISVSVTNTGHRAGKEIVQLYVRDVLSTVVRPQKELKGFIKIELQPGETKVVTFVLDKRAFAYYNIDLKDWHVETGDFEILIGQSSVEISLRETIRIESTVNIKRTYTRNSTLGDLMEDPKGAAIVQELIKNSPFGTVASANNETPVMMEAMVKSLPLRGLVAFSGGSMTDEMLEGLLRLINS